jgi:hypothetical protein
MSGRVTTVGGFPLSNNTVGSFQDGGQGASSRLASWMAFTTDPNPMLAPGTTTIVRDDTFEPMLDGISQGLGGGAVSGGDNAFIIDAGTGAVIHWDDGHFWDDPTVVWGP